MGEEEGGVGVNVISVGASGRGGASPASTPGGTDSGIWIRSEFPVSTGTPGLAVTVAGGSGVVVDGCAAAIPVIVSMAVAVSVATARFLTLGLCAPAGRECIFLGRVSVDAPLGVVDFRILHPSLRFSLMI